MPQIDLSILNQRQTPAFYADVLANRPAAGFIGRIFVSTDTYEFYRDNGTSWDIVGGPGSGTVTGGGSLYRVAIWNSTSSIGESNNLIFDFSTNRLGINTNTPGASLDVHSAASSIAQFNQTTATNNSLLVLQNSGSALWRLGNYYNAGANDFGVFDVIGAQQPLTIKKTTGQVLIGTSTVGSGKLVVSSATSDNGVQIVGASAPSLRIDNAESGPTKRAGLGISTAVNNFIQGSADRDFCIFNGSTAAASPILFGVYDAGLTNVQEAARISASRNLIINSSTDAGFRFDVNGTARIQNEITVNGTGTNTIDRITIARSGVDAQINAIGGGFMRLNAPRVIVAQNVIQSNSFISGTGTLIIHSGLDNPNITELQFRSSNANTIIGRFFPTTGNFGINTSADAGFRFECNGTARFTGQITANTVVFGTVAQAFTFSGQAYFGTVGGLGTINLDGGTVNIGNLANVTVNGSSLGNTPQNMLLKGTHNSGSAPIQTDLLINTTINYTSGGYTLRGIYYNPTITALFGNTHRAIETVVGDVCLGTTSGNVLIGTATSGASKLRIVGLPTSAAGLSSGDVYSNLGVLTIVP